MLLTIRTEIDSTDFKKEDLGSEVKKKQKKLENHTFHLKKKLMICQKILKQPKY